MATERQMQTGRMSLADSARRRADAAGMSESVTWNHARQREGEITTIIN